MLARVSGKTNANIPYKPNAPGYLPSVWYPSSSGGNNPQSDYGQLQKPGVTQSQVINIYDRRPGDETSSEEVIITIQPKENITASLEKPKPGKELALDEVIFDAKSIEAVDNVVAAESSLSQNRLKPSARRGAEQSKRKRYNGPKRGSNYNNRRPYATTTYPSYDSEYYDDPITTQRMKPRRKPTPKRNRRRTTTPVYDYDDEYDNYQEDNSFESTERVLVKNDPKRKRRPGNPPRRKPTTTENAYNDYYQDREKDGNSNSEAYDERLDYPIYPVVPKAPVLARQVMTTTTEISTSEASSSSEPSSSTSSTSSTTGMPPPANATHATGYGYGPYGGHDNVSLTYGPPGGGGGGYYNYDYGNPSGSGSGYGPSNGNENISITYGPPTGQRLDYVAPLLDAWYSQYAAKNAVVRRIQDLIQNNIYHNNADGNYNENNF